MKKIIISMAALVFASAISFSTAYATGTCTVASFTAGQTSIASGASTTVSWRTVGCDTVSITPSASPDNRPPSGSTGTGTLTQTTTFTIVGHTDAGATSNSRSVTIAVTGGGSSTGGSGSSTGVCKPTDFVAAEYTIDAGDSTVLHWDSDNCDTASIVPADYPGDRAPYGSISTGAIDRSTEFTLTVYDENGRIGGQRFLTVNVRSANSNNNNNNNNNNECSIDSFKADDTSIDEGDSTDLTWRTTDCDYVNITSSDRDYNDRDGDDSVSVSPDSDTTYTLHAYPGNHTKTVRISVDEDSGSSNDGKTCSIGYFRSSNGFIYRGQTASLSWDVSGDVDDIDIDQGLSNRGTGDGSVVIAPFNSTSYYMTIRCGNGTTRTASTSISVGVQPTNTVVTVPRTTTTVVAPARVVTNVVTAESAPSLLELRVESAYDRMCIGGTMDYTITYRNISSQTLENTVLRFTHPKEITYLSASRGDYEVIDRTLTIDLGSVRPGEQGTITIHTRVNEAAIRGNLTVATASVVYTNTVTRAQEDATAYSLITVSDDCPNLLGASVAGFGSFLPDTLIEWLLLILVILALIVLGRHMYKKNEQPKAL